MPFIFFFEPFVKLGKAAITKYHRLGGLNNRNSSSHRPEGWKSGVKV